MAVERCDESEKLSDTLRSLHLCGSIARPGMDRRARNPIRKIRVQNAMSL